MLYCPKCQKTYDEGSQRFCSVEGERLLPASAKSSDQTSGVFTNVLKRKTSEEGDKFSSVPKFSQTETRTFSQPNFSLPSSSKIFQSDPDLQLELEPQIESKPILSEPLPQFIKSREYPTIEERIDGGETESTSESDLGLGDPKSLVGQTIKNRYRVIEQSSEDESGIAYLAEDETFGDKKVIVRTFVDQGADNSFGNKVFAAEKDSLAQINHPNIANIIDSGKLFDGKPYIVTEYAEGKTVKVYLQKNGQFNVLRTSRIVRQAADALGEAHQLGIVHGNLNPENIVLTVTENGVEQVKLINFIAPKEKLNEENLLYKSPEQVEGKIANSASDEYSLAVIAYQMLTNRLPFNASSVGDLLKAQREGLTFRPSDVREDLPPLIDEILEKALSFNPFDRFSKVRDFGDDFFSEIIANSPLEMDEEEDVEIISNEIEVEKPVFTPSLQTEAETLTVISESIITDIEIPEDITVEEDEDLIRSVKATHDLAWEKRSPKPLHEANPRGNLVSILGVGVLLAALLGVWYYFINRPAETFVPIPGETVNQNVTLTENPPIVETNTTIAPTPEEVETPPLPRSIKQPPDTIYFQNSRENMKGDAMKNFLGFSLYYPKGWKLNEIKEEGRDSKTRSKFIDISKDASSGTPVEQMLVSYYSSKGTFKADSETFPSLVKETNSTLKKIVPNYEIVSEGAITVNNGWRAYEVKFQGTGKTENGEKITLWGRRLFIPTAIRGMKNGYVITMLATSLSKDVKSVKDVGVKGELSTILETFEPNQNF